MRLLSIVWAVVLLLPTPLFAQEAFEIAVYPYATARHGEWELEAHVNYVSRGTTAFDGAVAPTQGQLRFAGEITRGITDYWEAAGYLLGAQVPGMGLEYAGWRLRSRFRAPEAWRLPVDLGLSVEYEASQPAFRESAGTLEITPILERRFSGLQVILNPAFERDLTGPEQELEFEPRARSAFDVSKTVSLGLEYYGSLGETRQWHQVFPTADIRLGQEHALHFGVGFGTADANDRLVFKTRLEMEF